VKRHLLFLFAALSANVCGQSSNTSPPLIAGKAELLNTLKSANLKPGDLFYLRTTGLWHHGGCTIPSHTTITGHVESLTSSSTRPHNTILAVQFSEVPCAESASMVLTPLLIAVRAPDKTNDDHIGSPETPVLAGVFPSEVQRSAVLPSSGATGTNNLTRSLDADELDPHMSPPGKPMKTGEVRGYPGVALTLPGLEGPAAKLSSAHKIVLDRDTEFALAFALSSTAYEEPTATPQPAPRDTLTAEAANIPPPPAEMEDVCESAGCRELATVAESTSTRAVWTLPLAGLDYQPRLQQAIVGLDHSASVHFLGDDQILVTFTRHVLVPRPSDKDAWISNPRSVRAVLISRTDGHVLRVMDWTVSDDIGSFVWGLDGGVVIAHIGNDLVRLGPGLTIQQRFRLPGPLLFLSDSPRGNLLLVATVHEKHTEAEHAQIASFVGPDVPIDEEYDLTGVDSAFHVTGSKRVTVEPLRPALLQDSMISARPEHGVDWLLEESNWAGQSKRVARFRSICRLQVQSFPGDLLFVQGCSPLEGNTAWYRVLNAHGATLFKGTSPNSNFIQQVQSSDDGRLFAMASSQFNRPVNRTTTLHIGDFTNVTLTVYDTASGRQIFAAHPREGSAQADTFSLSPSGSVLAVLTSTSLQLFPLPMPKK